MNDEGLQEGADARSDRKHLNTVTIYGAKLCLHSAKGYKMWEEGVRSADG